MTKLRSLCINTAAILGGASGVTASGGSGRQGKSPSAAAGSVIESVHPYEKARRLEDGVEVDGGHSLKFERCVEAKILDEDIFDDNGVVEYAKDGQIVSVGSYVLFRLCREDDGSCDDGSDDDLYVIDLSTFVKNAAGYRAEAGQNQDGEDEENAAGHIEHLSQCGDTGIGWNGNGLYAGFMCSPYGDGVEIALFLDDECTAYTSLRSFIDLYSYDEESAFAEAEGYIKSAFTETTPCGGADDDDGYEANEYCQKIFEEGAIAFGNCAQNDNQNNGQGGNNNDNYNWYAYDMDYDDREDLEQVCSVLQRMDGEYEYRYDEDASGTWNDHSDSFWNSGGSGGSSSGGNVLRTFTTFPGGEGGSQWKDFKDGGWKDLATSTVAIIVYAVLSVLLLVGALFAIGAREERRRAVEGLDGRLV